MSDTIGGSRVPTIENRELRERLAEAQDPLVEMAIDASHLHGQIAALQDELRVVRAERDGLLGGANAGPVPRPVAARAHAARDRPPGTAALSNR